MAPIKGSGKHTEKEFYSLQNSICGFCLNIQRYYFQNVK